ncbi:hypothetical protein BgiBS90_023086 [Biomphalaria glabrata]|nr:hypothetical protein BgiBS90_023086 [Biomphalaria glabrata]
MKIPFNEASLPPLGHVVTSDLPLNKKGLSIHTRTIHERERTTPLVIRSKPPQELQSLSRLALSVEADNPLLA